MDRFAMLVEYLRVIASEIVVVSTGISDEDRATILSWSERFASGVKLIDHEWSDDFSQARNVGLAECTQPWTLVLDPDELPSVGMISHMSMVLSGEANREQAQGWLYWTINYWGGTVGEAQPYHWHCRLFRTGMGKFYRPVHELVELSGMPEHVTRGTPQLPSAPPLAYLIHSKPADRLASDDEYYNSIAPGLGDSQ